VESAIRLVISNYPISCFVIGLIGAGVSLARRSGPLTREVVFEALVAYFCLFAVGGFMLYNFVMHVFFGEMAAKFIGWEDSPFQGELGFASLGFGLVGLLAFRRDFGLRLAAIVGPSCFMWGAAGVHIYEMVVHRNFEPGNAGAFFWWDVAFPVVGFAFLIMWRKSLSPTATRSAGTLSPRAQLEPRHGM
jgi:hypothetical protein